MEISAWSNVLWDFIMIINLIFALHAFLTAPNVTIDTTAIDAMMHILWITKLPNAYLDQIVIKDYSFTMEFVIKNVSQVFTLIITQDIAKNAR